MCHYVWLKVHFGGLESTNFGHLHFLLVHVSLFLDQAPPTHRLYATLDSNSVILFLAIFFMIRLGGAQCRLYTAMECCGAEGTMQY